MKRLFFVFTILGVVLMAASCGTGTERSSESTVEEEKPMPEVNLDEDFGQKPWVVDIEAATLTNNNYRSANWSGKYMQLVFMTLKPGEIIDLEIHEGHDQFIRIEKGEARVYMGLTEENLDFVKEVEDDWAILIPAGYWHKVENIGDADLKLYTLYGPPEHPEGTVNKTYEEAKEAHHHH